MNMSLYSTGQDGYESCLAVIAIGYHNKCMILFASGAMLEIALSEMSGDPDEIGFEYEEGLGCGIYVWEGSGTYYHDDDGGDVEFNWKHTRKPTEEELAAILEYKNPWPELWPPSDLPVIPEKLDLNEHL